ncbi:hypothetical protein ASE01_08950 [Nocardioides sp. Root190]|uniref:hypothetical protein n=1 Tax=Nocardioides sp. Root190 TaxID=1736488 RepID=UPI0006FCDF51|nr:hypothetical protein [Nocardioides sp. Root190]KRB76887.1 hypothetical protein ASE01_08950 [Nocardioides sp. Root190]
MTIQYRPARTRGLIGAALGVALAAAALVPLSPPAQALVTPVVTNGGVNAKITLSDDHFHPGDTITISGEGFATDPGTAALPGNPVLAVKVNGDDFAATGFPWVAGGPSNIDPSTLPTSGGSGGYAAFEIVNGEFDGTLTIPASWNADNPGTVVLNFLGGSLSTTSPGKVLTPIGIQPSVTVLRPDERFIEVTSIAHTPGSNNNKSLAVKVRNFKRNGGGAQKIAFKIDSADIVVDGVADLQCKQTDAEGDGDFVIQLPTQVDSLTAGGHTLNALVGTDCGAVLPSDPGFPVGGWAGNFPAPFKVATATISSTTHVAGGTLSVDLAGYTKAGGGQKVALLLDAAPFPNYSSSPTIEPCVVTSVAGDGTATVNLPAGLSTGAHTLNVLAGTACGSGIPEAPSRSIALPFTVVEQPLAFSKAPTYAGTPRVGVRSTSSVTANKPGVTLTYQWLRSGVAITNAKSSSYVATAADAKKTLSVRVTATLGEDVVQATSVARTVALGVISNKTRAATSGTFKVGRTVKTTAGRWSVAGLTVKYQWLRNGKAIKGATKASYKLVRADRSRSVSVKVTVSRTGYTTASSTAAAKKVK